MIFYATALSSYSAKVRIVLAVKGIAVDEVAPPGRYRSAAYRAIVPMGTLPAIRVDDWVLSESEAINEYLEEQYPEPAMMPADLQLRARVRFLCRFHDLTLEPKIRALFAHVKPALRNPQQVAALRADIETRIAQLASWVQPQPWLLTPNISLADCGPLVNVPLAAMVLAACEQPISIPKNLQHWLDQAQQHPPVRLALDPWRTATQAWLAATTTGV
ncbi:MAG: glutathione S-transferase family protein [Betaproteobacteria bacterium]